MTSSSMPAVPKPKKFNRGTNMSEAPHVLSDSHAVMAIGYVSAELAAKADAWNGNAPDWFPQPPDWLDLWERALDATKSDAEADLTTA